MNKTILSMLFMPFLAMACMAQKIELPQFPGGAEKLSDYLEAQVENKRTSSMKNIDGGVNILFEVDSQGHIQNPIVGLSLHPTCDSIALEIIKEMPLWIPGKKDQKPSLMHASVRVVFGEGRAETTSGPVDIASDRSWVLKSDIANSLSPSDNFDGVEFADVESMEEVFVMSDIDIEDTSDSSDWDNDSQMKVSVHDIEERGIDIKEEESLDDTVDKPYTLVEQMPVYPGGEGAMNKFVKENLRYPVTAQEEGIQGRVNIRFIVEKDGTISNVNILRGIDSKCDKEAVRLVKSFPKWVPGKQNGNVVRVYYTMPIKFYLND